MNCKRILGICVLLFPLVALLGAMAWESGVIYMLVHFGLTLTFFAVVGLWLAVIAWLLCDSRLTLDDVKSAIYNELLNC